MRKQAQPLLKALSYLSRNLVRTCLLYMFVLSSFAVQAQEDQRISVDLRGESLESAIWHLQNQTKFVFMYATEDIENISNINVKAKNKTIAEIMDECLKGTNLTYEISGNAIVIKKRQNQPTATITGWVRDTNGEPLPGASVVA